MTTSSKNSSPGDLAKALGSLRVAYLALTVIGVGLVQIVSVKFLGLNKAFGFIPLGYNPDFWLYLLLTSAALAILLLTDYLFERTTRKGMTISGLMADILWFFIILFVFFQRG